MTQTFHPFNCCKLEYRSEEFHSCKSTEAESVFGAPRHFNTNLLFATLNLHGSSRPRNKRHLWVCPINISRCNPLDPNTITGNIGGHLNASLRCSKCSAQRSTLTRSESSGHHSSTSGSVLVHGANLTKWCTHWNRFPANSRSSLGRPKPRLNTIVPLLIIILIPPCGKLMGRDGNEIEFLDTGRAAITHGTI